MAFLGTPNIEGNKRTKPISDALKCLVNRNPEDLLKDKPKTIAQELALSLIKSARKGELKAMIELTDRIEGKPKQALIGGDDDDKPLIPPPLSPQDADLIQRYLTQKGK